MIIKACEDEYFEVYKNVCCECGDEIKRGNWCAVCLHKRYEENKRKKYVAWVVGNIPKNPLLIVLEKEEEEKSRRFRMFVREAKCMLQRAEYLRFVMLGEYAEPKA